MSGRSAQSVGSLAASASAKQELVQQGVDLFLKRVLQDLQTSALEAEAAVQASEGGLHLQALQALQSLGRGSKVGSGQSLPHEGVQTAFGRGGGLPLLVGLLDTAVTPKLGARQQLAAVTQGAVDALAAMTRNHADNRRTAIEAGAVPALCSVLGTGDDEPVSLDVLKALYSLIAPDTTGHTCSEVFASGGVHALIRLLANVLEFACEPQRSVWTRELLSLLFPLAHRSRLVAHLLASELAGLVFLLQTASDPLSLSLGMDLLEEILSSGDKRRIGRLAAREGALAALVRALHMRGLGAKAAPLLAALAADAALLAALRALLGAADFAALAALALQEARANDAAATAAALLGLLLAGADVAVLRSLALGRCLGACMAALPQQTPALAALASSDTGLLVLENLPTSAAAEVAIAATLLLQHAGSAAAAVLLRPGALAALLGSVADEVLAAEPSSDARLEATEALMAALQSLLGSVLPHSPLSATSESLSRGPSTGEQSHRALLDNGAPLKTPSFETVTLHVGGREFHALAWVVARASRAIARTLAQIPDPATAAVVVPEVPGMSTERMQEVFALALDCAYSGALEIPREDALDLWALAASLQMADVQARCEQHIPDVLGGDGVLEQALHYAHGHGEAGGSLRSLCGAHVLEHLGQLRAGGRLANLLQAHREDLVAGMTTVLRQRLAAARPLIRRGSLASVPSSGTSPRPSGEGLGESQRLASWPNGGESASCLGSATLPASFRPPSGVSSRGSMASMLSVAASEIEPAPLKL